MYNDIYNVKNMKNFSKNSVMGMVAILFASGFVGPVTALAAGPATVNILSAGNYVILAKTAVTTTGTTLVTGAIGISPAFSTDTSGFGLSLDGSGTFSTSALVVGRIYAADYTAPTPATLVTAVSAMEAAYTDASTRTPGVGAGNLNVGGGTLNGQNFVPGTYTWDTPGDVSITGDITLTGTASDIWIFQITGTLGLEANKKIILAGGASPQNIFWSVAGAVTLKTDSTFRGIILAQTNIAIQNGAILEGRALAQTAVTLIGNTVLIPVVSAPIQSSSGSGGREDSIVPLIGILNVPNPLALPGGSGPVTYDYTVWNVGGVRALIGVLVNDNRCSPAVLLSGDTNRDGKLDPTENWKYSCTTMLTTTTTNTAIATGYGDDRDHQSAAASAIATVVVGSAVQAPLINIVKLPSILSPLPSGGGSVTYLYTVTNPGAVSMSGVTVVDDKCAPLSGPFGDDNKNGLLDPSESWAYACKTYLFTSTMNVAIAQGYANGFTALGRAFATVLVFAPTAPLSTTVSIPSFPNSGFSPEGRTTAWNSFVCNQ